jgi:hypothetical protein
VMSPAGSNRGGQVSAVTRIRRRAYEIWEESGRAEGRESEHWEQVRREVESAENLAPESPAGRPRRRMMRPDTIDKSRSSEIPS